MKLLLDTHALIWAATDVDRLSVRAADAIRDPNNDVHVSAITGWEIAIKRARGRLQFPDVDRTMLESLRLTELPVLLRHTAAVGALPEHHRDPFDRMLIAQAQCDRLVLATADPRLAAYGVELV